MSFIGERLKEERDRLGLSQEAFGEVGGVKKLAQRNYEKGNRVPDAVYLSELAKVGADIQYIVAGVRSSNLVGEEAQLLAGFRQMDEQTKRRTLAMVYSGTPPGPSVNMHVKGDVGNQIGTNSGTIKVDMRRKK